MIFEQAFHTLPEILCGSKYPSQDYEAGIVVAMTLAILQELNGRNANNPLSYIKAESLYRKGGVFDGVQNPRYLRADLEVNIGNLYVANRKLAQYGWRHSNWLEAKFFRNQTSDGTRHSSNKTTHSANILADLVRLSTLIADGTDANVPWLTKSARYFLHVYDSDPRFYLPLRDRTWLKDLIAPGERTVTVNNLANEVPTFINTLGGLGDLSVELKVNNLCVLPQISTHRPVYYCYLTRIDEIRVTVRAHSFTINKSREISETSAGDYREISAYVAQNLHIVPADAVPEVEQDDEPPATDAVGG